MSEKFSTSFRGYNKDEVNEFLVKVTEEYESMLNRLKKSDEENEKLKKELEEYKDIESSLRRTILLAEEGNRNIRKLTKDESDSMLEEARHNASRIINDALLKAEKIENDSETLKRKIIMYQKRVKDILDEQKELIDRYQDIEY